MFLPGYLFTALSTFSWICWFAPDNRVVNQLFGVESGLGMGMLTFDWAQITWVGSPLMVPWWAEVHVIAGFILFYWILCPIMYYTNVSPSLLRHTLASLASLYLSLLSARFAFVAFCLFARLRWLRLLLVVPEIFAHSHSCHSFESNNP